MIAILREDVMVDLGMTTNEKGFSIWLLSSRPCFSKN